MAWIKGGSQSSLDADYICINQEGDAIFSLKLPDVPSISPFSPCANGSSFIETQKAVYQIDKSGNIINSYSTSDNVTCKTFEEGQIWIEEYTSDFDSAGYTYTLYDENGKKLTEFSVEGTESIGEIVYHGKGVWSYNTFNSDGDWIQMSYFTQSNKWINTGAGDDFYFYDDTAVLGFAYEDPDVTGYRAKMGLVDTRGNLKEVGLSGDLGWNWSESYINEDYCILEDYERRLISYNVSSGEFKMLDNEYAERIRMDALPDKLMFTGGLVALSLKGNDENDYVGLFNASWDIVGEPIQCSKFDFSEGKLTVAQHVSEESNNEVSRNEVKVYNIDGEQIFNAYEKGYHALTSYKDGIACALDVDANRLTIAGADGYGRIIRSSDFSDDLPLDFGWKYIDENGKYLFDSINTDHVKTVELE